MSFCRVTDEAGPTTDALRRWLDGDDERRLLVETSGSTGRPKRVLLSRGAVLASAAATERRLGGSGAWAVRLPTSYIAGVQTIVRSLVAGAEPVLDGWTGARYTSLVPTQLARRLEQPSEVAALRGLDAVLLGGGPMPPGLRERAAADGIRTVATYGSAETAGGCVYDGEPLDGVGLALGADGRIRIAGPTLFDEYDGDPGLTAESLVDGWFLTSDAGRLDGAGRLQVLGRLDDVVVSGGVNVPGGVVAARLREHPAVDAAEVVGVDDAEWGRAVVAVVVGELDLEAARAWVAAEHPRAWAPRRLVVVPALPMLPNGKVDRIALVGLCGESDGHQVTSGLPVDGGSR